MRHRCWSRAARARSLFVTLSVAAGLAFGAVGCGKEEEPDPEPKAAKGEQCEVTADCKKELACRKSTCIPSNSTLGDSCETHSDCTPEYNIYCRSGSCEVVNPTGDAGVDTSLPPQDAGDTGVEPDGGSDLNEESYLISYVLIDEQTDQGKLHVFNTGDGSDVTVSPEGVNCRGNCWLSRDKKHFVYTKSAGGGTLSIFVADVGSDLKAKGSGSALVKEVQDVTMLGNRVTYVKGESNGAETARVQPVAGGSAETIGSVESGGDWYVDANNDVGVVYSIGQSSQSMEIKIGKATSRSSDDSFTLGGPNFQEESGTYFGGNVLTETSRDGSLVAFITEEAPNDYERCTRKNSSDPWSSDECSTDKLYKCGTEQKCTRLELTAHFVDMDNKGNLGEKCGGGTDACGPIHECYVPSDKQLNEARCIPRRVVLGVPNTKQGPDRETSGCEIVKKDDSIDFTSVRGPLSFDSNNNLYLVGLRNRDCLGEYDVPSSQIVKVNPRKGTYDQLEGLPNDKSFDASRCWNRNEQRLEIDADCYVYVDTARLSPKGNEIAYTATNPNTSTPAQARQFVHLWHMIRDGSERWFTGDKDTSPTQIVKYIRVHPAGN